MANQTRSFMLLGTAASAFALAWCGLTAGASAQTAPAPANPSAGSQASANTANGDEEVIVTAQRRTQNVIDVGIAVAALSGQALSDRRIQELSDLDGELPNVAVKDQIPGAIPVISIRGVGLDDFSSTNNPAAGVYVDDVFLSSLALMSSNFFDLQRVEVLKGPQGTLYGRNSTAGAINILSAAPQNYFESRVSAGYGNYQRFEGDAMLNLPLGSNAAFRIAAHTIQQNEGFWTSRLVGNIGRVNIWEGRAQLAWDFNPDWRLNFKVEGERSRSEMGQGQFFGTVNYATGTPPNFTCNPILAGHIDNTQCTDVFGYTNTSTNPFVGDWEHPHPQYDIDELGETLHLTGNLGFATLTSITGYVDFSRNFYIDSDATPLREFEFNQRDKIHQFSQELRLTGDTGTLNWILGAFYSHDNVKVNTPGYLDDLFGTEVLITADQTTSSGAAFANGEWKLTDRLSLVTGVRYTTESKDYAGGTLDKNPFGASFLINPFCPGPALPCQLSYVDTRIDAHFWSWRVGLNWHPDDDTLLYASASRGQKSGGFFSGITLANAQLAPYRPEQLTAYEIGVKYRLPAARLHAEAAAFYYDYSDLQTFIRVDLGPISVQALGNVPSAHVEGIDASLDWNITHALTLQAGLGLLSTELGAFTTVAGPVPKGHDLPNAPGVSFEGRAIYEWSLGSNMFLRAQAGAEYAEGSFKDALNDPVIASQDHWVYDARLALGSEDGNWELALWGQNLTNEHYVEQGLNSGLGAGNRNFNAPRTYGVQLTRHFQ
jgi:iron complex outermembrane receptor protein